MLLPVIFCIHGGAFIQGSGNSDFYGPEYLLQHNVVVVTCNYRIGALGKIEFEIVSLDVYIYIACETSHICTQEKYFEEAFTP